MPTTKPFRCLPGGTYRVDLYSGGTLIGRGSAQADLENVHQAAVAPDLDLRACVPAGWTFSDHSQPGLIYGKEDPAGTHGVFLYRFEAHPERADHSSQLFAGWAVDLLGDDARELRGALPVRTGYFATLRQPVHLSYDIDGSVVEVRVGLADEDAGRSGVVVAVMGPGPWVRSEQVRTILNSVTPYYETVESP